MTDSALIRGCIIGVGLGVLVFLFAYQHGGASPPPAIPAGRPPVAVVRVIPPSAGPGASFSQESSPAAPSNQRPLPAMYASSALRVAVPDAFHNIHYLPGNDPAAIQYLDQQRAAENNLAFDNSPQNAGSDNLPPPNAFSPKLKKISVKSGGGN